MKKKILEEGIVNGKQYRVVLKREYWYISENARITYMMYKVQMKIPFVPIWITIKNFKDDKNDAVELYNAIVNPNKFI